jgi:uncharacterized membrane protein
MERREKSFSRSIFILFVCFFIWFLLQVLAPLFLPTGSVSDLSGVTVFSDNTDLIRTMPFPWSTVYSAGDSLCHQKAERSLFINGNQMPFCSRCTAIWFGIAIGLGIMLFFTITLNEKFIFFIFLCFVPIGIDGVGQLFHLWESTNIIRIITGLIAGIITGIAIGVILDEIKTLKAFKKI